MRILLVPALLLITASCAAPPPLQQGANCPYARAALAAPRPTPVPVPPVAAAPVPLVAPAPPAPPPPAALAAPAVTVAAVTPPPTPVAAVYVPVPVLNPLSVGAGAVRKVFGRLLPAPLAPPSAGRLTLSNYTYDLADVEALVTPYPDCALHPGMTPIDFKLVLNSTRIIPTPPGSDVCWRRQVVPQQAATPGTTPGWTEWARDYTAPGRFIDSEL